MTLVGLAQYIARHGIEAEGVLRMVGVYRSPDNFALYVGRLAPLAAALALLAPVKVGWRALYAAGAGLGLIAVLLSFTRGAWIGVFAAMLVVVAFAGRRWLVAGVLSGAALAAALSTLQARRVRVAVSVHPGQHRVHAPGAMAFAGRMIADYPWFGVGLDNFLYQYPRYILTDARTSRIPFHPHDLFFWTSGAGSASLDSPR